MSSATRNIELPCLELLLFGAGTAAYHAGEAIVHDPKIASQLRRVTIIDKARIRTNSVITCPDYVGHLGRFKADRLAEMVRAALGPSVEVSIVTGPVQQVDYPRLLNAPAKNGPPFVVGLVCLDDWEARVAVDRGLRQAAYQATANVVICQISFDQGGAQTVVLVPDYPSACLVCGIGGVLPKPECCVVFRRGSEQETLRGNLHREATAAADQVCAVLHSLLAGDRRFVGTKTDIVIEDSRRVTRTTRPRPRTAWCWGPHDPQGEPLTLDELFLHEEK